MRIFILLTLLLPVVSQADSDHQIWSSIKPKGKTKSWSYGVEVENRTTVQEQQSLVNTHQIKPEIFYKLSKGRLGLIQNYVTDGSLNRKRENRFSLVYDLDPWQFSRFNIQTRLRQEFRNFIEQDDLAYRFRMQNRLIFKSVMLLGAVPSLSSEWRVYQTDAGGEKVKNFSHRTIFALTKKVDDFQASLFYLHNYQKEDGADENTHVLGLNLQAFL